MDSQLFSILKITSVRKYSFNDIYRQWIGRKIFVPMCSFKGKSKQANSSIYGMKQLSPLFFFSTFHCFCWNIKMPSCTYGACVRGRGGKKKRNYIQKQNAVDMRKHLLGVGSKLYFFCRHFCRGRIKPSSEGETAWIVLAPVPPLPTHSNSESSQAFTWTERSVCL